MQDDLDKFIAERAKHNPEFPKLLAEAAKRRKEKNVELNKAVENFLNALDALVKAEGAYKDKKEALEAADDGNLEEFLSWFSD